MAEKDLIVKEKLEHSGIFDFPTLYSFAHSWLKEGGYGVNEDRYSEKVGGGKRDIIIEWKATKNISDYFREEYKIKFEIKELTNVEVEIDGEKKKTNQGKVEVEISGTLVKDKESKWETSPFNKFLRDVYNKFIIPARVNDRAESVGNTARTFLEKIKSFLELSAKR